MLWATRHRGAAGLQWFEVSSLRTNLGQPLLEFFLPFALPLRLSFRQQFVLGL
jgi:hypothetical protein